VADVLARVEALEPSAWHAILREVEKGTGVEQLAGLLKFPCLLADATKFIYALDGYDDQSLLIKIVQVLMADPNDLARRASGEGLEATTHLLNCARYNDA